MEDLLIKEMYSRNFPFINQEIQQKLSDLNVALIGVGLSSQVAGALVRIGVLKFKIWDKDDVSLSNLNRQLFDLNNINMNKAESTRHKLLKINNRLEIQAFPKHFKPEDLKSALVDIDIVVNSADFDTDLVYDINDYSQMNGKWCIQPLNLGFGGSCMVFGAKSPSLSEITGGRQKNPAYFIKNMLGSAKGFAPGPELLEHGEGLLSNGGKPGWFPQNIIATLITTALITWAIVKIAEGKGDIICAPAMLHFNPENIWQ